MTNDKVGIFCVNHLITVIRYRPVSYQLSSILNAFYVFFTKAGRTEG